VIVSSPMAIRDSVASFSISCRSILIKIIHLSATACWSFAAAIRKAVRYHKWSCQVKGAGLIKGLFVRLLGEFFANPTNFRLDPPECYKKPAIQPVSTCSTSLPLLNLAIILQRVAAGSEA
jgi:hypothetical protein